VPLVVLLPFPFFLFPDGVVASRRSRWVLRAFIGCEAFSLVWVAVVELDAALLRPIRIDSSGSFTLLDSPSGSWATYKTAVTALFFVPYGVFCLAAAVRQVSSFR
jgi:hypothetical protein